MEAARKLKIVCFGGGTGLPSLLRGLKYNPFLDITAIVNMFDTGGSSGELRDRFGVLPPGDVLRCLLSLSMDDTGVRKVLLQRIKNGHSTEHTGGNVLLMGLEKVYGDLETAIDALGQIISTRGKVIPVTLSQGTLCARYTDESIYKGETEVDRGIREGKEIKEIFLEPDVRASTNAVKAIQEADILSVGPGSFYTSVLPNFLPTGIREALRASKAPVVLIVNLLTEGAGMRTYDVERVIKETERYLGRPVELAVVNRYVPSEETVKLYEAEEKLPLLHRNGSSIAGLSTKIAPGDFWTDPEIARHDYNYLATSLWSEIVKLISPR